LTSVSGEAVSPIPVLRRFAEVVLDRDGDDGSLEFSTTGSSIRR